MRERVCEPVCVLDFELEIVGELDGVLDGDGVRVRVPLGVPDGERDGVCVSVPERDGVGVPVGLGLGVGV